MGGNRQCRADRHYRSRRGPFAGTMDQVRPCGNFAVPPKGNPASQIGRPGSHLTPSGGGRRADPVQKQDPGDQINALEGIDSSRPVTEVSASAMPISRLLARKGVSAVWAVWAGQDPVRRRPPNRLILLHSLVAPRVSAVSAVSADPSPNFRNFRKPTPIGVSGTNSWPRRFVWAALSTPSTRSGLPVVTRRTPPSKHRYK